MRAYGREMSAPAAVSISYHRRRSLQLTKPRACIGVFSSTPLIDMCDDLTIGLLGSINVKDL